VSDASPRLILEQHREWLGSGGRAGRQASVNGAALAGSDLRGMKLARADLKGSNLAGADLSGADLSSADLEAADLANANLEAADLAGANLRRCNLQGCRLRGVKGFAQAALRDVNLQGATGLVGTEFAGADLAGARLPDSLSFEGRLSYIAETSQNARPVFVSILLSCVFIILTVVSTPDAALLSNASLAVLPDLATNIPATSFFWVAPILLLCLYVYLHLHMSGIGETLYELPAVFPDGTPLEKRAYPWIATNLLRLRGGWRDLRFEEMVAIGLLWGAVPVTLLVIWLRYLPFRDWMMSGLHVALVVACFWGAIRLFEQTATKMCRGDLSIRHRRGLLCSLGALLVATTLAAGLFPILFDANPRRIPSFVIDVRGADLSRAVLRHKDLRSAAGREANLIGADLRDTDFRRADFQRSAFVGADLESADLQRTDLDSADFRNACLRKASLRDADMEDADFRGAYLGRTDLRSRLLTRANFTGANLQGADLRDADLTGANFERAIVGCYASQKKELEPDIECADLHGALLQRARFAAADLRYAEGLTQAQLDGACGDKATLLPEGLRLPACAEAAPGAAEEPQPAEQNPCAHEIRDDRWPQ
jgi:uncharacterized protein YjbI with pentapeptide repeats